MPRGLPTWIADARTRPVMQLTAVKMDDWFLFGNSKLLKRDLDADRKQHANMINPAVKKKVIERNTAGVNPDKETGYTSSERVALENQLMQIESVANAIQEKHKN